MKCGPAASKFGEFVVKNLWDEPVAWFDRLDRGDGQAGYSTLHEQLAAFSPEQRAVIRELVLRSLDVGLHRFLFALGEAHDFNQGIAVVVDGVNVVEQSDGLHGETYGPDGWMAKYSKHPEDYPEYK